MESLYIEKRKKITVATTISASGLIKAGGSNVVYGLYTQLAKDFDIEVIYIAPAHEKSRTYSIAPGLKEVVIPKTKSHIEKEQKLRMELNADTAYDIGLIYFLDETPEYGRKLRQSILTSDLVIIERPYLYREVKKHLSGRVLFQRSQNIEYFFRQSNTPESDASAKVLQDLFDLEKECCEGCMINYACSEEDLEIMNAMYAISEKKLCLLPNGVSCEENPYISIDEKIQLKKLYNLENEKIAIFIGGGHRPNIEASEMILKVAEYCQNTKFFFAGNVCQPLLSRKRSNNIGFLGLISEKTRHFLFSVADIALNPMYSGSGSNIKMFDYMAMGVPVVTTLFGARGINDKSSFHIADTAEAIADVIENFDIKHEYRNVKQARKLVESTYDWSVIANDVSKLICKYIQ